MRYAAEHKDQTRSALLKAAAEEMRAHGPDGVSVAAVMKRVGLTHGGFYGVHMLAQTLGLNPFVQ